MGRPVGRDREVEAVDAFLDNADSGARVLLLEGEPGIGKTTVWNGGIAAAEERGFTVLTATAAEGETRLSFTVLRDLIDPVFDDVADELPAPQRQAFAVTLLREEPPARPLEPGTIAVAFTRALRILGERNALLVAVDDVQWLDAASAAVLAYALRRAEQTRFFALLTRRPREVDVVGVDRLERSGVETIALGALSVGAIGRILHDELGVAFPRPTLHRLHEVSGGNPFFALELARVPEESPAAELSGEPLRVPTSLRQVVRTRLGALPAETLDALAYVAVMPRPSVALLAAACDQEPEAVLAPAIDTHVIHIQGNELRFAHPLLAASVLELASPQRIREIHQRLAAIVVDSEERVRHLALGASGPDAAIATALEESARRTDARGHRIVSAELYEAAARFTPDHDVEDRARRILAAAAAVFDAGDTNRAAASIEALLAETADGVERVDAQLLLGKILADVGRWDDCMRLWREALAATDDSGRVADIQTSIAAMSVYTGSSTEAVVHADEAIAAARKCDDTRRLAHAYAARAVAGVAAGDESYGTFLRDALELEPAEAGATSAWDWGPPVAAAWCALHALDVDEMRRRFGSMLARAVDSGNADLEQYGAYGLAHAELAAGNVARATELSDVVERLAAEMGVLHLPAALLRAEIDTHAGRAAEARMRLVAVIAESEADGKQRYEWHARAALGALHLSEGDGTAAAAELHRARDVAEEIGIRDPALLVSLVDETEAAVEADLVEQADDALAAARSLRAQTGWAPSLLARAEAAVAARRRLEEAGTSLARAVEQGTHLPLHHGRALLALGSVQRRLRKRAAARETLEAALAMFQQLGAPLWADRARAELGRIGGRPAASGELTPSEQRIADLVAEGKTNKEVAAALTISERTVESALSQIYRKLEIRSRTELARKLSDDA